MFSNLLLSMGEKQRQMLALFVSLFLAISSYLEDMDANTSVFHTCFCLTEKSRG